MKDFQFKILDDHYLALGRFINQFAMAEAAVYEFLVMVSGIDQAIGPALFSGTRMDGGVGLIRRVYEARKGPMDQLLGRRSTASPSSAPSEMISCTTALVLTLKVRRTLT